MSRRTPPRHQARRAALQVLYAADLAATEGADKGVREAFERVAAHFDLHEGARAFASELALGVEAHREELDARIAACARNWRVDRMPAVDRNVLRLAAWELLYGEAPAAVVIDQAVELARDFGSERSPAFVNGVLDALAREVETPGAEADGGGRGA